MARSFTRAQIRTRARYRADMVGESFVTDAEFNDYFNEALALYWTIMSQCSPADFAVSETTITTVSGTADYALPADFRALLEVYADEGSGMRRPILPVEGFQRVYYKPPQSTDPIILRYQANAPTITDDTTAVNLGELGDALMVRLMARDALAKQESDTGGVEMEIQRLEKQLRASRQRDRANAQRIRDVECTDVWIYTQNVKIRGYMLSAENITLLSPIVPLP